MTLDQLISVFQVCNGSPNKVILSDLLNALNHVEEEIGNKLEFVNFLNQCAFETQVFSKFEENLYYTSSARLKVVWPNLFKLKYNPQDYVRNPEKLANLVYANKLGNGNEASGDGYRFRGRGAFHLTGRANYAECSHDLYSDSRLVDNPNLVTALQMAFMTALWFWRKNHCGDKIQEDSCSKITKIITGCLLTENERNVQYQKLKRILL